MIDLNGDGVISDEELKKAEETLKKAKQQKLQQGQRKAFMDFDPESITQSEYK